MMQSAHKSILWLAAICLAMFVAGNASAKVNLPDFTPLVEKNAAAVVNISTTKTVKRNGPGGFGLDERQLPENHPFREFLKRFQEPQQFDATSLGSGFIISSDGYVMTNDHVVRNADEIIVRLSDRREYQAELIGGDPQSDIALLKIESDEDLPVVSIGESSALKVGEWVLAIGSPFGFEHSVTAGIVSAKGRSLPQENYVPFIQTDVAINPGNSGGPLFNLDGQVVGVNSHIFSRTGGFMGLSFAIPIELAVGVADQLREQGRVSRGWLGVVIQDVTRELAESFGMDKPSGALIADVLANSPAAEAGLQAGDIIIAYNGREIRTSAALPPMVGVTGIGEEVELDIIREGDEITVNVTIGELPEDINGRARESETPEDSQPAPGAFESLGLTVSDTPEDHAQAGQGVLVEDVASDGPARASGMAPGDVISMLNGKKITSLKRFEEIVEALPSGKSVPVLVIRGDRPRWLALKTPD